MEQWLSRLQAKIAEASAGQCEFPVKFTIGRVATVEEVHDAFRLAREVDQRVTVVEHQVGYSHSTPCSTFTVRVGQFDPNPPPFLEQHPMPLLS